MGSPERGYNPNPETQEQVTDDQRDVILLTYLNAFGIRDPQTQKPWQLHDVFCQIDSLWESYGDDAMTRYELAMANCDEPDEWGNCGSVSSEELDLWSQAHNILKERKVRGHGDPFSRATALAERRGSPDPRRGKGRYTREAEPARV